MQIEVPGITERDLTEDRQGEDSAAIRARVVAARDRQAVAPGRAGMHCNAHMGPKELKEFCALDEAGHNFLSRAATQFGFSARAHHRLLKLARTIADLAGEERISLGHLAEAVQYRVLDRRGMA